MEITGTPQDPAVSPAETGIVFDTASGISEEEQREILAGIEQAAGEHRLVSPQRSLREEAQKRGALFPVLVNIAAILLLGGGFFALFVFHNQDVSELREGSAELGLTERRLIEEIRKETTSQIDEKEREISGMAAQLAGIDTELQNLQAAADKRLSDKERELRQIMGGEFDAERQRLMAQNLSEAAIAEEMRKFDEQRIARLNGDLAAYRQQLDAEKLASESNFRQLQEEYRNSLAVLQNERGQILEDSRAREAALYAQAESRIGELSSLYERSGADLNAAREELSRLALEQERSALIEGQLNGYYIEVNRLIREGLFDKAAGTLESMEEFLNTPAFQHVRSLQSRKEYHLAAINALVSMVKDARQNRGGFVPPAPDVSGEIAAYEDAIGELRDQNSRLEQSLEDQRRTIAAYRSEGTSLGQQITEFETRIDDLRKQTETLSETVKVRDRDLTGLQTQVETLQTQNSLQEQTLRTRETEITALRTQANAQEQRLQVQINTLQSQNTEQRAQLAERDTTITRITGEKNKVQEEYDNLYKTVEATARNFLNNP
jgi:chromosome segregation ATPase